MHEETRQLWAFFEALLINPRDTQTMLVLADWLDEHDCHDAAHQYRQGATNLTRVLKGAEAYVRSFCEQYGADYDELLKNIKNGDGYCFGDDDGPDQARIDKEFQRHVETLLGVRLIITPWEDQSFRCAC